MHLTIPAQQRQRDHQPPHRRDQQRQAQCGKLAQTNGPCAQYQRQADHKGDAASNVAPGVPAGGQIVHPLRRGHVGQHRVVVHQTAGVADLCQNKDHQKRQPLAGKAHDAAAHYADPQAEHEDGLFEALVSAKAPSTGLSSAVTRVTTLVAYPQ